MLENVTRIENDTLLPLFVRALRRLRGGQMMPRRELVSIGVHLTFVKKLHL